MNDKELLKFKRKYQNQWIAVNKKSGKVLAAHKDLSKLAKNLKQSKIDYVIQKVLPLDSVFVS